MIGRHHKTLYSDNAFGQSFYPNNTGQLNRETDPDGVSTLYQYNAKEVSKNNCRISMACAILKAWPSI
jgi:hypothetical protein